MKNIDLKIRIKAIFLEFGLKKYTLLLFSWLIFFIVIYSLFLIFFMKEYYVFSFLFFLIFISFFIYFYHELNKKINFIVNYFDKSSQKIKKEEFEKMFCDLYFTSLEEMNDKADLLWEMISHDMFYVHADLLLSKTEEVEDYFLKKELKEFLAFRLLERELEEIGISFENGVLK